MTRGTTVCHRGHWRCVDADGDVDVAVEDVRADVGFVRVYVFVLKFFFWSVFGLLLRTYCCLLSKVWIPLA